MKKQEITFVPEDLKDCFLYVLDENLCRRWPELMQAWTAAYPGVDIMAEVKKAHAWEVNNPQRRKRNRPRFLNNWLARVQDAYRPGRSAEVVSPAQNGKRGMIRELMAHQGRRVGNYEVSSAGLWKPGAHMQPGECIPWGMLSLERLQSILEEVKYGVLDNGD